MCFSLERFGPPSDDVGRRLEVAGTDGDDLESDRLELLAVEHESATVRASARCGKERSKARMKGSQRSNSGKDDLLEDERRSRALGIDYVVSAQLAFHAVEPLTLLPVEFLELVPLGADHNGFGIYARLLGSLADSEVGFDWCSVSSNPMGGTQGAHLDRQRSSRSCRYHQLLFCRYKPGNSLGQVKPDLLSSHLRVVACDSGLLREEVVGNGDRGRFPGCTNCQREPNEEIQAAHCPQCPF